MSKVLVTGSNGFVGVRTVQALRAAGHEVVEVRRYAAPGCIGVGEIDGTTDWSTVLPGIQVVVHLAARVHMMNDIAADPMAEFRRVNATGTARLAREAARNGVKRLVYMSSVKAMGESRGGVYSENQESAPSDPYGISKFEAEQELKRIIAETGLEIVILRPPLVYGPGVKANFLSLSRAVCKGLPLPLGCINNQRSLVFVGNLADAIVRCVSHPGASGEAFLVSDGTDISTADLVRRISRAAGVRARLIPVPVALLRALGMLAGKSEAVERLTESLVLDSSKIRRQLQWAPPYTLEAGLKQTLNWIRSGEGKS